jgi:hypothetical protein
MPYKIGFVAPEDPPPKNGFVAPPMAGKPTGKALPEGPWGKGDPAILRGLAYGESKKGEDRAQEKGAGSHIASSIGPEDTGPKMNSAGELLVYNYKQFGGLVRIVPRIFADPYCTVRDLGQLIVRAHSWLKGLRGKEKEKKQSFHNRFVEVFLRCWHANGRGQGIFASEEEDEKALESCRQFRAHVLEYLRWTEAQNEIQEHGLASLHTSIGNVLYDVDAAEANISSRYRQAAKHGPVSSRAGPGALAAGRGRDGTGAAAFGYYEEPWPPPRGGGGSEWPMAHSDWRGPDGRSRGYR